MARASTTSMLSFFGSRLGRFFAMAECVRGGMLAALDQRPDCVGYWDAGLATPVEALDEFCDVLDRRPEVELVMGARVKLLGRTIDRKPLGHYVGRCFAPAASWILGLPVYDTQGGAKLVRVSDSTRKLFQQDVPAHNDHSAAPTSAWPTGRCDLWRKRLSTMFSAR